MHLSEGVIQTYLDGEMSPEETLETKQHLLSCDVCRESLALLQQRAEGNRSKFDALSPAVEQAPDSGALLQQILSRRFDTPVRRQRKWKQLSAAVLAIAALIAVFSFKPVRVWATEFLSLFRVQQIAVVRFDPANLKQMEGGLFGEEAERRIEQLLADNVHISKRGEVQTVQSVNDAARFAGFGIRMPSSLQPTRIRVHPAVDASFDIDVERLQGILDEAGRSDVRIPENLDGEMIRVNVPSSVTAVFGTCPEPDASESERRDADRYKDCKFLVQLPTPVMVAPPTLNVAEIGMQLLKLLGFSEEQARKFSESVDWGTTLVVPFDQRMMNVQEVDIDGVKGHLFASPHRTRFNVLWIRDGILYSFMGRGNADEGLAIARSL